MPQQVALVTGSSSGFGLLTVLELCRRGCRVFATMRDPQRGLNLRAAATEEGLSPEVVTLDVSRSESIRSAVQEIEKRAGRVDVLVNNAGFGMGGFAEDVSMEELREQFETNFFGLVDLTKQVIPGMRERRGGRIINVSSLNGQVAVPALSAYCASKFAVEGYSEALWHELLPFGIHVILVEPGTFRTQIFERGKRMAAASQDPGSPYFALGKRLEKHAMERAERSKADPAQVARLIGKLATAPRRAPRLRYPVGIDSQLVQRINRWMPSSAWARAVQLATRRM
jgi:NAD(P)-dependent dehydrogenase (short-subunit alcohol dehydrogenase family)